MSRIQPNPPDRLHVAIIMDGNGRWACERGLPRVAGHRAGVEAARRVVEAAPGLGIGTLTVYAFSADNWTRPKAEVRDLFQLLRTYLGTQTGECIARGIRLCAIGRRDRLPAALRVAVAASEAATAGGRGLLLRIALDYSARDSILRAAQRAPRGVPLTAQAFERLLAEVEGSPEPAPPVDLLIRTGGEQRLSDFQLWESAYAELLFTPTMWPDFVPADLKAAVAEFGNRERRFGGLPRRAAS